MALRDPEHARADGPRERREGSMRNHYVMIRRSMMVAAAVLLVAFAGCSSVEPTDAWSVETGSVTGTVRSDTGQTLPGIEVWMWAELGVDGREVWYSTVTDQSGAYEIDGVEMATAHSYEATYWIGANRNAERSTPINDSYRSSAGTVTVPRGETCEWHAVISWVDDGPTDPENYVDE
jgi:hypothetical protein